MDEALDLLQLLGLNEYEARCYVGLTRMGSATSKRLSEVTDVPRTRVYDAIRVLEAQGLVEVQHTSPKRFRAVPVHDAVDRIRNRYQARFAELQEALNTIEDIDSTDDSAPQQVWSVSGREAVESRAIQLMEDASLAVHLALGDDSLLTDPFAQVLTEVAEYAELVIHTPSQAMRDRIRDLVTGARTHSSEVGWLNQPSASSAEATLGRLLVVDQSAALISVIDLETDAENALFSRGSTAPLVFLTCQLVADEGLSRAPESEA